MPETSLPRPREWPLSLKLIAILAVVLLPLGAFAAVLSANSYRSIVADRSLLAITRFDGYERVIGASLEADFIVLRTALLDAPGDVAASRVVACALLERAASYDRAIQVISRIDARGAPVCADTVLPPHVTARLRELGGAGDSRFKRAVVAEPGGRAFWLLMRDEGAGSGDAVVARFSSDALRVLLPDTALGSNTRLTLSDGPRVVMTWGGLRSCESGSCIEIERPVGNVGLWLELADRKSVLTAAQAGAIALPLLMWLAALGIGWWAARILVAEPLVRMQRAVERYRSGDKLQRIGDENLQSREMAQFAAAFDRTADELGRHEADLHTALTEQKRLTREVHHRVKNNLQIVSSLLSIQARDAETEPVAQAYSAMQARVGALALVHRWAYDESGGKAVDLRALLLDLTAALEQQLAASEDMPVRLVAQLSSAAVDQDTAIPLAFAVTEIVSQAARAARPDGLDCRLELESSEGRMTLTIAAEIFDRDLLTDQAAGPAQRIVSGMVRQLRGRLSHHPDRRRYEIEFPQPALQLDVHHVA